MDEVTSETHKNWVAFSQPITIKTPKTYTYTVTSDASTTGSAVFEGKPVTFTIKRNDVGDETQVYLSTEQVLQMIVIIKNIISSFKIWSTRNNQDICS